MFPVRPNPKKAYKELRTNILLFGTIVTVARVSTYVLHLWQKGSSRK